MGAMLSLAVFSGLSLNLILCFCLGIRDIQDTPIRFSAYRWIILFLTVLLLWLCFSYIFTPLGAGFFEFFLIYPLTAVLCGAFELLLFRFFPQFFSNSVPEASFARTSYNGLVIAALLVTLGLANTFMEAAVLALGFSLGGLVSVRILTAIHKRSARETVPAILRGMPLMLISMGLLALICASVAVILLRVLGPR